jgi:hypothetical protein
MRALESRLPPKRRLSSEWHQLPFTVEHLEQFLVEKMGVKFEEKIDPEIGEVVRVPVPPPGMEDWFCALPDDAPRKL